MREWMAALALVLLADPATITRQVFVLRDVGGGVTRVDETITVESSGPLIGTVVDGGFGAHTRFMLGAKHRLEAADLKEH